MSCACKIKVLFLTICYDAMEKGQLPWENSRHSSTPPLVSQFPREMTSDSENPYWWPVTTQTWVGASDWLKQIYNQSEGSALVNIRRKALLSSVGFRKRMTSRSPRGVYLPVTHACFCFDRPLWCVWWSDGLFRGLVLLFRSFLDWFNQENATASVWKWSFNVSPRSSLLANREGPFSGCYWVNIPWMAPDGMAFKKNETNKQMNRCPI